MFELTGDMKKYIQDRVKVNETTGCWEWQLSLNPTTGYGQIGAKPYTAHRLAYITWHGDPGSLIVRHLCHNRRCCNPAHLGQGTHLDNYHDSAENHAEADQRRRGRPSRNARPIVINGVRYGSLLEAQKALRLSYKTLLRVGSLVA